MKFVFYALVVFPLVLVVIFSGWKWIDNARFARNFFQDKVEIVRVVASKKWHDFSDDHFACTYAAVEFSEASADLLRAQGPRALIGRGWFDGGVEQWNLSWEPTPTEAPYIDQLDTSSWWCLQFLPKREFDQISDSLTKPGSWFYRDHQVRAILSAEHRLAVTLRFGD